MSRKRSRAATLTAVPAAGWGARAGSLRDVPGLWFQFVPMMLPAIALAYVCNGAALKWVMVSKQHPGSWGTALSPGALLTIGLWLAGSWIGQVWAAALVLRAQSGRPVNPRASLALVTARLSQLGAAFAARATVVYAPLLALAALMGSMVARHATFNNNPLPVLVLLVVSLAVNFSLITALLACVVLAEPGLSLWQALAHARDRAFGAYGALALAGGPLFIIVALGSLVRIYGQTQILPNHLVGSGLWVLLPVLYVRARRAAEPDWGPDDLAAALESGRG